MLETVLLGEAQYEKHSNPKYNQDEYLNNMIKTEIEGSDVRGDVAIVGEYAYELDRSVPKIGRYLGKAEDLIFPDVKVTNIQLEGDYKSATFTITATIDEKAQRGFNRIEIWLSGHKIDEIQCNNEKTKIIENYTVKRNGIYTIKAYADISESTTATVEGIVPSVEFSTNGGTWKKEHTTKVLVKETEETIKSLKYKWTNSVKEPAESEFTEAENCPEDGMITGKDVTGEYYLWVLLETETGKKNICGSEAFYFDNEAPTAEILTEWFEENEKNKLRIILNNARDTHSGVDYDSVQLYLISEDEIKQEKKMDISDGKGIAIVDDITKDQTTIVEISIKDKAGNIFTTQKKTGRIYFIKNGTLIDSTPYVIKGYVTQNVDGSEYCVLGLKTGYTSAKFAGVQVVWPLDGKGIINCELDQNNPGSANTKTAFALGTGWLSNGPHAWSDSLYPHQWSIALPEDVFTSEKPGFTAEIPAIGRRKDLMADVCGEPEGHNRKVRAV